MKNNKEEKYLIIKNMVCFFISLCPIYGLKIFGIFARANGFDFENILSIVVMMPFIYAVLIMTGIIALPCFLATIKYMIDMIKSKTKVILVITEIMVYMGIILYIIITK